MRELYPPIQPYHSGYIQTGSIHELYFEECGNKEGIPILFLHGGPGSGLDPNHRRFFDPKAFRIILMDQRGSGKSKPYASLQNNTTSDLVQDIELLRESLHIESWAVFGGSWGSTLALCYAIAFPKRVRHLILRGIFLGRKRDIDWFYRKGADHIYPEEWERFLAVLDPKERQDPIQGYYAIFTSSDEKRKEEAARAWIRWEGIALQLSLNPKIFEDFTRDMRVLSLSFIECHYFRHGCFFEENYILNHASAIQEIPTVIVHGRYDMICPFENAWELKKKLKNAKLVIAELAGHSAMEKEIRSALIEATDALR